MRRHPYFRSTTAVLTSVIFPLLAHQTLSQPSQPQSVGGAAFARVGNNFYIQGGATYADNLVQTFWSLDLSQPWTTAAPAWTSLPAGPYNGFHSAGYSSDNSTFYTFGRDTAASASQVAASWLNIYDIATKTWSAPPTGSVVLQDNSRRDFSVVTNPSANKIYILGGDGGPAGSTLSNAFNVYDPATKTLTETTSTGPQNPSTYGAVWASKLGAMLVIGGGNSPNLWIYWPLTGGWSTQNTTGTFAYSRNSHCAASNADGSLVAIFGGFPIGSGTADPNAYILNTQSWTWTTVPYSGKGRGNAACTVVDNTFMVWGGFYTTPSTNGGVPTGAECMLLLDLQKLQWQLSYTPSSAMISGGNGNGGGGNGTSGSGGSGKGGMSAGLIGGICAAAVAVLVVGAWAIYERNRRKRQRHQKVPQQEESEMRMQSASHHGDGGGGGGAVGGVGAYGHGASNNGKPAVGAYGNGGGGAGGNFGDPSLAIAANVAVNDVYAAELQRQYDQQQFDQQQQQLLEQQQFQQRQEQLLQQQQHQHDYSPKIFQPQQQQQQYPQNQQHYQNQFTQPSPHMSDAHYTKPNVAEYLDSEPANTDSMYGDSYGLGYPSPTSSSAAPIGTIYYPPPPPVTVAPAPDTPDPTYEKGSGAMFTSSAGSPQVTPYNSSGYHDYGRDSLMTTSTADDSYKRLSSPQGGPGFGTVDLGSPGAPQAIIP
ncbi:hypothetical protein BGZ83_007377 [Gryganskiella cystojenkinii]|nr:hypothetical protein BGZ83_007377 [Gryganskiella cystojenkinii]